LIDAVQEQSAAPKVRTAASRGQNHRRSVRGVEPLNRQESTSRARPSKGVGEEDEVAKDDSQETNQQVGSACWSGRRRRLGRPLTRSTTPRSGTYARRAARVAVRPRRRSPASLQTLPPRRPAAPRCSTL